MHAPCFLTFCSSDQSLLLFKFKIFILNTSISLGTLVPNSRDRQGKLWLPNVFGKQPNNNISFKYKP